MNIDRRAFLGLGAALGFWPQDVLALGPRSEISIARLAIGADALYRPESLRRLLWDARTRTSIHVARDAIDIQPGDEEMFWQPLMVWSGNADPGTLPESTRVELQRYLQFGGMLWVDTDQPDSPFAIRVRQELEAILGNSFSPLDSGKHVLFKSFFMLDKVYGRTMNDSRAYGIEIQKRSAVILTQSDVLGAMERDRLGTWKFDCLPDGDRQREYAFRFGINILMYATCTDYKSDQVHIPFIMKKKRR